jgi:tRNA-intron endonuclease
MTPKAREQAVSGKLLVNKVTVNKDYGELVEKNFGKKHEGRVELAFTEALYLLDKSRIKITRDGKSYNFRKLMEFAIKKDKRLHEKYIVYKDLRDRGLVVKTGFKFGCDFRVYRRGVGVKRGPKKAEEHTKWIVFTVPEDYKCAFQELSRAVRLAHSIRARMLWAIVDNESDVTYMEVVRIKP